MRVLLYEYLTGGGLWSEAADITASSSLLQEGAAMLGALAADFASLPETEVWTTLDARRTDVTLPLHRSGVVDSSQRERSLLTSWGRKADGVILIAPECGGALLDRTRWVEQAGGTLLSPDSHLVELAGDKHQTARWLHAAGLPSPAGRLLAFADPLPDDFPYPAVLKPVDGAGSLGVQWVSGHKQCVDRSVSQGRWRLEEYCPGRSASIAVLFGGAENVVLPPMIQRQSDDGCFRYMGGASLLDEDLVRRARRLGERAANALSSAAPSARGYVGIDLILGEDSTADRVIEVNPRLTTSYLGLRALCDDNLAQAMLETAQGGTRRPTFTVSPIQFGAG